MPISVRVNVSETIEHGMRDAVRFAIPYWNSTGVGGKMTGPVMQGGVAKFKITSGKADRFRLIAADGELSVTPRGRDRCDVRFNGRLDIAIQVAVPSFVINSFVPTFASGTLQLASDFVSEQLDLERQAKQQRRGAGGEREVA